MKFRFFSILLILSVNLTANTKSFNQLILSNQIDLKSKSLKTWIRIFNSPEKIKKNGFIISNAERFTIVKGLKTLKNRTIRKYSRRVR